jgi:hypothetical protein
VLFANSITGRMFAFDAGTVYWNNGHARFQLGEPSRRSTPSPCLDLAQRGVWRVGRPSSRAPLLTSDVDDMSRLCGNRVQTIAV